ncbi:MAG: hypothetical protein N2D54_08005, partial [Chloroflexota bacterium]
VDYAHETEEKTEALMFIFWGGTLSDTEISQIKLPPNELLNYKFSKHEALPAKLSPSLKARILSSWQQVHENGDIYVEN